MEMTRFTYSFFVLVLAVGEVAPAPTCECNKIKDMKLNEQSCLLNHLLQVISHLVSCNQSQNKPVVTPDSYQKLLELTNCAEKQSQNSEPTTESLNLETSTAPSWPVTEKPTTLEPATEESEESIDDSSEESTTAPLGSPMEPITWFPTDSDESSDETSESSEEVDDTTLPLPSSSIGSTGPHTFPPEPSVPTTEEPKTTTDSEEATVATYFPSWSYTPEVSSTPEPEKPTTEPSPKEEDTGCSAKDDSTVEHNGLKFKAETFFIPVLKLHSAPCMSAQELRDYLFSILPLSGDKKDC